MPWGPWITPDPMRVGKWVGAGPTIKRYGGAFDEAGGLLMDGDDLDLAHVTAVGQAVDGSWSTDVIDATAEQKARDSTLLTFPTDPNVNVIAPLVVNEAFDSSITFADVDPVGDLRAHFRQFQSIASGIGCVDSQDAMQGVFNHPDFIEHYQLHPDDLIGNGLTTDYVAVYDQWVTVLWDTGYASSVSDYDSTPTISVTEFDPSNTAQPGDSAYPGSLQARWPADVPYVPTPQGAGGLAVPAATIGPYGVLATLPVTDKAAKMTVVGYLPYLFDSDALTVWAWAVDGTTVGRAAFPMVPRIITDFLYQPPRFRVWVEGGVVPPLRQYPRDDTLAVGTPRLWPPPQSQQHSPARLDGYF